MAGTRTDGRAETRVLGSGETLPDLLASAEALARGAADPATADALADLRERLAEGRLHLAVLGQFKRGKSTLLNALLGEALLPTSAVPLTAVPTLVSGSAERRLRVEFTDGRPPVVLTGEAVTTAAIAGFVAEEANPANRLGVATVEVLHPSSALWGVVLADTPGIGSTLRHNTETTLDFLPRCDAALFVLSVDPPITQAELDFLGAVRHAAPRVIFVLNKTDQIEAAERDRVLAFVRATLRSQAGGDGEAEFFPLSAREALAAKRTGDAARLAASGLPALEGRLRGFLASEAGAVLRYGIARKALAILGAQEETLGLRLEALRLPLEEVERRLAAFDRAIRDLERQRLIASDLLAGDLRRARGLLEEQASDLRVRARAVLGRVLDQSLAAAPDGGAAPVAIAAAMPAFFEEELAGMVLGFDAALRKMLAPHQERLTALTDEVRRTAATLFEIPHAASDERVAFEPTREPYWVTRSDAGSIGAAAVGTLERLLPARRRHARARQRLQAELDALVVRNVENLRWATLQNLESAFRRFDRETDERLTRVTAATRQAISVALAYRQERREGVNEETARVRRTLACLRGVAGRIRSLLEA